MIDYLGYNLTQYKSFRQLELEYVKILALNQSLQAQVESLKELYEKKCKQVLEVKNEEVREKIRAQNQNLKYKNMYQQLLDHIDLLNRPKDMGNSIIKISGDASISQSRMNTSQNDKSAFFHLQEPQILQKVCKKLTQMSRQVESSKEKNAHLTKRIQTFESLYKSESLQKQKTEMMIVKQVQNLQNQLEHLNQVNVELEAKLNIKEKEKRKADVGLRHWRQENAELEQRVGELMNERAEKSQEDSEFAIDFMTFQLHSIQSIFTRTSQETKCSGDISNLMSILYSDYEQLSEIFREKLQIEYDLEELQQRYKSQKSSSTAEETLLIETRRQIEAFRLELLKQKEIFRQKEQYIEEHFDEYCKINEQELKIKNYSYELQNKLYKQKRSGVETSERFVTARNPTARDILFRRTGDLDRHSEVQTNSKNLSAQKQDFLAQKQEFLKHEKEEDTADNKEESSQMPSKKTSLRFKQTQNADELMSEIMKKDKANMEKILKETRKTPLFAGR